MLLAKAFADPESSTWVARQRWKIDYIFFLRFTESRSLVSGKWRWYEKRKFWHFELTPSAVWHVETAPFVWIRLQRDADLNWCYCRRLPKLSVQYASSCKVIFSHSSLHRSKRYQTDALLRNDRKLLFR